MEAEWEYIKTIVRKYGLQVGIAALGALIALGITIGLFLLVSDSDTSTDDIYAPEAELIANNGTEHDLEGCSIVGIEIRGCIHSYYAGSNPLDPNSCDTETSSEEVADILSTAKAKSSIQAVLLNVDSPGGAAYAGEEIAHAVADFGKPSVAWIRSQGLSAAYWAITPADVIIASKTSDVGSIGVTSSYVDNAIQNRNDGLTYNQLSTGKFKDIGDPDKPLTQDERNLVERDLYIMRDAYITDVATYRSLPREKVVMMADGSSMLGEMAKQHGLIDRVGGKKEVWEELQKVTGEDPVVCWPQFDTDSSS